MKTSGWIHTHLTEVNIVPLFMTNVPPEYSNTAEATENKSWARDEWKEETFLPHWPLEKCILHPVPWTSSPT